MRRRLKREAAACALVSGSRLSKPLAHVVSITDTGAFRQAQKPSSSGAQLNSLFARSWPSGGGRPRETGDSSPLDQIQEIAGQPQATGCRLQAARWGSQGCSAAQDLWGEVTLRPLGQPRPKQTTEHMSRAQPLVKLFILRRWLSTL